MSFQKGDKNAENPIARTKVFYVANIEHHISFEQTHVIPLPLLILT